jgi:hypothetical protein
MSILKSNTQSLGNGFLIKENPEGFGSQVCCSTCGKVIREITGLEKMMIESFQPTTVQHCGNTAILHLPR